MERLQAYKFQLRPKAGQESLMRRFAGCCRFLWNKALALEKETYEKEGKRLGFSLLCEALRDWKKENDTSFLAEAHSQILQQALKDLDRPTKTSLPSVRISRVSGERGFMTPSAIRRVSGSMKTTAAYFCPKSAMSAIATAAG